MEKSFPLSNFVEIQIFDIKTYEGICTAKKKQHTAVFLLFQRNYQVFSILV